MRIVILDEIVMNETQISRIKTLGEVVVYNQKPLTHDETLARCKDADVIVTGWTTFDAFLLKELSNTKLIALWSTGYDQIDIEAARACGIRVTNVRGYAQNAVAEMALSLMLAVYRKVGLADQDVRKKKAYDWHPFLGRELTGKTLGIVGLGAIGKKVARIAQGFDMQVLVHTPRRDDAFAKAMSLSYVDKDTLIKNSDIISLHLPLIEETRKFISKVEIGQMKNSAMLINTARGGLVDQEALVEALSTGKLFGAGLDDIILDCKSAADLMTLDNVVLTPHIGFNTEEALVVKTDTCIDNIEAFISGNPVNVVI